MSDATERSLIRVAALTGGRHTASTRFRVRQYIEPLRRYGIETTEHIPYFGKSCHLPSPFKIASHVPGLFRSRGADMVWLSRDLVQGYETFERLVKRPRILDVDDAIWHSVPFGRWAQPRIARAMDAIVVGNQYLADWYGAYNRNIHIIPTAVDIDRYRPRAVTGEQAVEGARGDTVVGGSRSGEPGHSRSGRFVIGWTGMACNYAFIKPIVPVLDRFLRTHDDAELLLTANRPWRSCPLPRDRVRYVPWSPENEIATLHAMSVGIMPLDDTPWTRGKCSFKMIQYMAVGIPVIASPVGMNRDVLALGELGFGADSHDDWYQAMETLYQQPELVERMGAVGRRVAERCFNRDTIAAQLAEVFRQWAP